MFGANRINPKQALRRTISAMVLLLCLMVGFSQADAQSQNQEQLRQYMNRTTELLEWARDVVLETENRRARQVLQEAAGLHERSMQMMADERPLSAYSVARRAREAVWLAVRLARDAMSSEEQARVRAERFKDLYQQLHERAGETRNEQALTALRQAENQGQRAREQYLQGNANQATKLLEQGEQILRRVRRMLEDGGTPDRLEQELERTRLLIERTRELAGDDANPDATRLLTEATRSLDRAREDLAQGQPVRARRKIEMARQQAQQAAEVGGQQPGIDSIRHQIERWDERASVLAEQVEASGSRQAKQALAKAREHRARATEHLAAGEAQRALRQIRAGHERLDQARKSIR